ncbi:S8 family serine peptidase [Kitasatospora sp. NPDC090091]|uniref:S8 family serine peptidase n=1 Tax=Kitasatospora sp. NPDC090091 TaxID=3364081 RepID=UPI00381EC4B8
MAVQLGDARAREGDLLSLGRLAAATEGVPEIVVGLIDGPVVVGHPALAGERIRVLGAPATAAGSAAAAPVTRAAPALSHGTFVAGLLHARRGTPAPGICPACTLLVRPVFADGAPPEAGGAGRVRGADDNGGPWATAEELARAIVDCVRAGAGLLNISAALVGLAPAGERYLREALDFARDREVVVFVAAGNRGLVGGSMLTRHPWAVPVVAYGRDAVPLPSCDLAASMGRRGLGAPGQDIDGITPGGGGTRSSGTSAATPLVTGAAALVWSCVPQARGAAVRSALLQAVAWPRRGVAPPLLDAWRAYALLSGGG